MKVDDPAFGVLQVLVRTSAGYPDNVTRELLEDAARRALQATNREIDESSVSQLADQAETVFAIRQDAADAFDDDDTYEPWLNGRQTELFPRSGCWQNFRSELEGTIPPRALDALNSDTDLILDRLKDPSSPGAWQKRGLVVGYVQSGKTNNYLGLVTKAIDAGYRMIVVLAGVHDNLRVQTQKRFDAAITGVDLSHPDGRQRKVGVGLRHTRTRVMSMTKATDNGDFQQAVASQVANPFEHTDVPTLFVIKKHWKILENLYAWLKANAELRPGQQKVADFPLLLIDDEADNASIDTNDPSDDPTRTNAGIRSILNLFAQSAYVGYTATPFANIFIDPARDDETVGDDLFPRDFIIKLRAPANYVGPATVFQLEAGDGTNPLVRHVRDLDSWIPLRHQSSFRPVVGLHPPSLTSALDSFILACAARRLRGQGDRPTSMLVHVTRFTQTQNDVAEELRTMVDARKNELLYGDDDGPAWTALRDLWECDFAPTSNWLSQSRNDAQIHTFDRLADHIRAAVPLLLVKVINGSSDDVLHDDVPVAQIAVGGQKLSRGLTLPDLTVSYYARGTNLYDTLMQMGRWFGYRDGYFDLCRVYTTPDIVASFRSVNQAIVELDEELEVLRTTSNRQLTPRQFGLTVRHSPGMLATSRVKMRTAQLCRIGFANSRPETVSLEKEEPVRKLALQHLDQLLADADRTGLHLQDRPRQGCHRWQDVPSELIVRYLRGLQADGLYRFAVRSHPRYLADYIEKRAASGCLTTWTIMLNSNNQAPADRRKTLESLGIAVGLAKRTYSGVDGRYSFNSLIGSADEQADLDLFRPDLAAAPASERPIGKEMRLIRPETHGLLMLYLLDPNADNVPGQGDTPYSGFSFSFPATSTEDSLVEYWLNPVEQGI